MRRKRLRFNLGQFRTIAQRVADSNTGPGAFSHSNANQHCHGDQSG